MVNSTFLLISWCLLLMLLLQGTKTGLIVLGLIANYIGIAVLLIEAIKRSENMLE